MTSRSVNKNGFTLIEILVALAVFTIIATLTSSVIYQSFDTRKRINQQLDDLSDVQLALAIIQRDTTQAIERPVRGNEMHPFAPFIGRINYVELTRAGIVNPQALEQRSTQKRIAYLCQADQLIRRSWTSLDPVDRHQYHDQVLLKSLSECSFAYLTHERSVVTDWKIMDLSSLKLINSTLPIAFQLTISINNTKKTSLLFILPEALYASTW